MKKDNGENSKIPYIVIYLFLIIIIIVALIYIFKFLSIKKEAEEESNLLNTIELENNIEYNENENNKNEKNNNKINEEDQENEKIERIAKVKKLKEQNQDIVGWLEIEGTNINYPVLQGDDNEYYMSHNYKKEKSEKGSIFLDCNYDWDKPSSNLLIYGHNIITGEIFKDLLKYSDEEFYKEHKTIRFTTVEEDLEFEVLSAFKSRVYYESEENVFRYYQFIDAKNEKEYNEFVDNAKKSSIYDTNVNAEYGDQLITLSTCSYHTENGRFALIGRKINAKKEKQE